MIGVRGDRELRIPIAVEPVRQAFDDRQAICIPVHERERGAA